MKMNEQEYLQRIMDILMDNAHEMCAIDGDTQDVILDVNMDGVQTVAREICNVFKPVQKDTRSRREQALDDTFAHMGVKPRVYHFTKDIAPFAGITIATEKHSWDAVRDLVVYYTYPTYFYPSEILCRKLRREEIYGVAICNKSDAFSKRYGRMKAKGKLIQHLLKEQKE